MAHIHVSCLAACQQHSRTPWRCEICGARYSLQHQPRSFQTWASAALLCAALVALCALAGVAGVADAAVHQRRAMERVRRQRARQVFGTSALLGAAAVVKAALAGPRRLPPGM